MLQVDGSRLLPRAGDHGGHISGSVLVELPAAANTRKAGEYYALLLYSVAGQCIMVSAHELIVLSSASRSLRFPPTCWRVPEAREAGQRGGGKVPSCWGRLRNRVPAVRDCADLRARRVRPALSAIRQALEHSKTASAGLLVGTAAALMFVGFAFKVSPHPSRSGRRTFTGRAGPVTAFLATGSKAAAFAIFFRVFLTALGPIAWRWRGSSGPPAADHDRGELRRAGADQSESGCWPIARSRTPATSWWRWPPIPRRARGRHVLLAVYVFMEHRGICAGGLLGRKGAVRDVEDLAGLGVRQPVTARCSRCCYCR